MGPVNDYVSSIVVAQLLFLQSESAKKPIHLYINSPGGSVTAGLAIYDTMQYVLPPICKLLSFCGISLKMFFKILNILNSIFLFLQLLGVSVKPLQWEVFFWLLELQVFNLETADVCLHFIIFLFVYLFRNETFAAKLSNHDSPTVWRCLWPSYRYSNSS